MGLFIKINKTEETNQDVFYSFCTSLGNSGKVSIDKKTGECFVIEEPEWDKESELASRVFRVLARHWRDGKFPDMTMWAS